MRACKRVDIKWSANFAYAIGLLTTDGNLSSDGRHFIFTSKDKELAELFKTCLGLKNKIGKKSRQKEGEKKYFVVQFGDINFYSWCLSIGLSPNKSKTLSNLKIPKKYFFDFLRGCFDGDGSSYAYWDSRWHSSYMFYLTLISASPKFLEWVQNEIEKFLNIKGHITVSKRSKQLKFAKNETKILFRKIYYKENIPFLKRKYLKLKNFIFVDAKHAQVEKLVYSLP